MAERAGLTWKNLYKMVKGMGKHNSNNKIEELPFCYLGRLASQQLFLVVQGVLLVLSHPKDKYTQKVKTKHHPYYIWVVYFSPLVLL